MNTTFLSPPKIIGQLNGQDVKIAKVKGEFIWHDHADEDEMFLNQMNMLEQGNLQRGRT